MKGRLLSTIAGAVMVGVASVAGVDVLSAQAPARPSVQPSAPLLAIVDQVAALFPRVSGDVIEVQGSVVTLGIGKRDGVQPGLELTLFRQGRELRHPKTGEVLGRTENSVGRVRVQEVFEAYSTGSVPAGTQVAPGDVARISAGKQRVTVVAMVSGVRESVVESALGEIVEGLNRTGRFQVAIGDRVGVWAAEQGIKPEQVLDGRGLVEAADRFRLEHVLALHFSMVQRRPFVEARFLSLPSTTALMTSTAFVPPSVRSTAQGQRFSSGGDRNPAQPRQRSLLARILGGELEAGSYSSGENSIPLKEIGKFGFPVTSMDVSVAPKDQIARVVLTDGDRIWVYRIVERVMEPEWTYDNRFSRPGRIMSVQLADLDGDGVLEVVAVRYHPDPQILLTSFIIGSRDGKPVEIYRDSTQFLYAFDVDGGGVKKTLWAQAFSPETFFRKGHAVRNVLKGDTLVPDGLARVPASFRATGATMANISGKGPGPRSLVFIDEQNRLRVAVETEDAFRSSTPVGGGGYLKVEVLKRNERGGRSEFFHFEPMPLAVDLDGDGIDEVVVPQNQLDGHLAIMFRGPAGYRLQTINSGFEGTITGFGTIPGDNPPTLIAAVVRFNNFFRTAGETQIIMTTGE